MRRISPYGAFRRPRQPREGAAFCTMAMNDTGPRFGHALRHEPHAGHVAQLQIAVHRHPHDAMCEVFFDFRE